MPRKIFLPAIIFFTLFAVAMGNEAQAGKMSFVESIFKHIDDVGKYGKKAKNMAKSQLDDIVKRFPALAGKSKEVIKGAAAIEQATKKAPAAGRMIESGINPARVAQVAELHPERIKLGDEIAERLAKSKLPQNASGIPPKAAAAARSMEGNYAKAGEDFLEMTRKGGKKAVEVAGKLYEAATPGKVGAALAASLLAWHMLDPQGAEGAVKDFFNNHVAPVLGAVAKGATESVGQTVDQTLASVSEQGANILNNHWKLLTLCGFVLVFLLVPNLRRLPAALINRYCGKLLSRIQDSQITAPTNSKRKEPQQKQDKDTRINIYSRKRG